MKPGDKIYWKPEALEDYQERFCVAGWTPETLGVIVDMDCSETGSHIEGIPYDWCIESVDGDVLAPRVYVFESDIVPAKGQIPLPLKFKKKKRGLAMVEMTFAEFFGGGGEVEEVAVYPLRPPLLHNLHVMSERSINRTVLNLEDEREEDELF